MIKLCPACAEFVHARLPWPPPRDRPSLWEETCLGGWGACDRCGVVQSCRAPGEPYEGRAVSLAFFKADVEDLHALEGREPVRDPFKPERKFP